MPNSPAEMLNWQYRQLIGELQQVELHASDSSCPCGLRDIGEFCLPKHSLSVEKLSAETAAMDSHNAALLYELQESAIATHDLLKSHVCGKGKDADIVAWARDWRKKIEPIYYACKAKLKDSADLEAKPKKEPVAEEWVISGSKQVPLFSGKEPWMMTREEFALMQAEKNYQWSLAQKDKYAKKGQEQDLAILEAVRQGRTLKGERFASFEGLVDRNRRYLLRQALSEGKPVPPEVLKDYPDLTTLVETPQQARERIKKTMQRQSMGTYFKEMPVVEGRLTDEEIRNRMIDTQNRQIAARAEELRRYEQQGVPPKGAEAITSESATPRIMGVPSVLADSQVIDGVRYDLFGSAATGDTRAAIRIMDNDSNEVLLLKQFPTQDIARREFGDTVAKATRMSKTGAEAMPEEARPRQAAMFSPKRPACTPDQAQKLERCIQHLKERNRQAGQPEQGTGRKGAPNPFAVCQKSVGCRKDDARIDKLAQALIADRGRFRESGYTVCQQGKKLVHGPHADGDHSSVTVSVACPTGAKPVAIYHTHPSGHLEPSDLDLKASQRFGIPVCIGQTDGPTVSCHQG